MPIANVHAGGKRAKGIIHGDLKIHDRGRPETGVGIVLNHVQSDRNNTGNSATGASGNVIFHHWPDFGGAGFQELALHHAVTRFNSLGQNLRHADAKGQPVRHTSGDVDVHPNKSIVICPDRAVGTVVGKLRKRARRLVQE